MDINEILEKLDLSPSEARAYLAILNSGEIAVSEVGKLIGVTRMAGYTASEELVVKGLLSYTHTGKTKRVVAENPEILLAKMREMRARLHAEEEKLKEAIPELKTLFLSSDIKPKIKIYYGLDGLKTASEDILNTLKPGESYLAYGATRDDFIPLEDYFSDFVPRRVESKISFRGIVPDYQEHNESEDKAKLRELRVIPVEKFPFNNEINIYGNKMSIISFRDKIGLVIESKQIVETQKLIFNLAWEGAKIYTK